MIVSIVTPSYNQGQFIGSTIESVLSQEGDFRLDYILVDGASTDKSVEIIKHFESLLYEEKWPVRCRGIRYRWVSEKDKGQADAIAKGFRMAEGEIIAWLNSDDTYLPGSIAKVVTLFSGDPDAHIVYGKTHFTSEKEEIIGKYPTEPFDYTRLATFNFICQPSAFIRKSALEKSGGLDTNLRFVMDYDLWIRMARNYRFTYLPEFLSTYRLHDLSKTMAAGEAAANHEEALHTVMKHYGWAPANRVYGSCYNLLKAWVPVFLADADILLVPFSILFSLLRYVRLNRGIRFDDIKMINFRNVRKLFMKPIDIFKGY